MNNFLAKLQRDWRWRALVRGIKRGWGLPVEPIDYNPEAQMIRLGERLCRLGEADAEKSSKSSGNDQPENDAEA